LTLSLEVGGSQRQERENLCFPLSFLKKNEKNTGRCCVICVVFEIVRSTFAIDLYIYTNGTWSAKVHTYFHFAAVIKLFVLVHWRSKNVPLVLPSFLVFSPFCERFSQVDPFWKDFKK
jgi:hypothetical protein